MKINVIQHVAFEGLGAIEHWCRSRNVDHQFHRIFKNEPIPAADQVEFAVLLGGPMGVEDELPWLEEERQFILEMIDQKKPVLGICLGAQQIAKAVGATIFQGAFREAGWLPIRTTTEKWSFLPEELSVFHWHGDQFSLPEGAERLFESDVCANQGFVYRENVIGLQFHFESTKNSIESILDHDAAFLDGTLYTQTAEQIKAQKIPENNKVILCNILNYLADPLKH